MEFEIISKEVIKPSSPTPPHLKTFKLSLLDQLTTPLYVPFAFFYHPPPIKSTTTISHQLKHSLSKTLAKYYPFAGRHIDGATIDCNDEGIEFLEARIHCALSEILQNSEDEIINLLFPTHFLWLNKSQDSNCLLSVQVTFFDCGRMTVSLCISHKITDGFSISMFVNDWAAASRGEEVYPEFIALSSELTEEVVDVQQFEVEKSKCVTRRFVFDSSNLAHLKAKASNLGLRNPTRVELVTALIYKSATAAARARSGSGSGSGSGSSRNSSLIHLVNMRPRMTLPFSKNSVGNFTWYITISAGKNSEIELSDLCHQLQEGIHQLCHPNGEEIKFKEWISEISKSVKMVKVLFDDIDIYRCSSFCRFPMYEVDFGWGKPIWVRMANSVFKNFFILMDGRDGNGIEALVTLEEGDMALFQQDEDLLAFASMNPTVF